MKRRQLAEAHKPTDRAARQQSNKDIYVFLLFAAGAWGGDDSVTAKFCIHRKETLRANTVDDKKKSLETAPLNHHPLSPKNKQTKRHPPSTR